MRRKNHYSATYDRDAVLRFSLEHANSGRRKLIFRLDEHISVMYFVQFVTRVPRVRANPTEKKKETFFTFEIAQYSAVREPR